ncbi:acyltransferase family-domain-containing protein [Xylariomycetidae sp. FL0641]|nr:acyltransferase family-domain-containing protein [Xylariomycetidae sp. FL0641]
MNPASSPPGDNNQESLLSQLPLAEYPGQKLVFRSPPRPLSLRRLASQCLQFARPSFLKKTSPSPVRTEKAETLRKPHSTEYLDGVRGVASTIVFLLHWSHMSFPSVNGGWGYKGNTSLWLLPFLRLVYSGAAMVAVFFVVSGFVLSHRFIRQMHRREYLDLFQGLTSLTFRRAIRLFVPAFVSSVLTFACTCMGIVAAPRKVHGKPFEHGWAAYLEFLDAESNLWAWKTDAFGFYNPQLWSVAVEFRGSMVIFLIVLGLAKTRAAVRLLVEGLLIVHSFGHQRWDVALFVAGMSLAELELMLRKPWTRWKKVAINMALVLMLVFGIFLSGYPREHPTKTPGYRWTKYVWPFTAYRRRFWLAISAMLMVGATVFLPCVQAVFVTRPARYLGRISFALYLVHGLGNRTIGGWLLKGCWAVLGKENYWACVTSFLVATAVYMPVLVWVSDMFWRAVDIPSIDLARWLERRCAS